jgi:hypothetical protein
MVCKNSKTVRERFHENGYWQCQHQGQFPFQPAIEQMSDRFFSHFGVELSDFDGRSRSNRLGAA